MASAGAYPQKLMAEQYTAVPSWGGGTLLPSGPGKEGMKHPAYYHELLLATIKSMTSRVPRGTEI